jgi:hypothetical protein
MTPKITARIKEIKRWESKIDHRKPLTVDMIHFKKKQKKQRYVARRHLTRWNKQCTIGKQLAYTPVSDSRNGLRTITLPVSTK